MSNQIKHSHNPQQSALAPNPHTHTQCGTRGRRPRRKSQAESGGKSSRREKTDTSSVCLVLDRADMHTLSTFGMDNGLAFDALQTLWDYPVGLVTTNCQRSKGSVAYCLLVCAISGEVGYGRFPSHWWFVRICVVWGGDINTKVYNELTLYRSLFTSHSGCAGAHRFPKPFKRLIAHAADTFHAFLALKLMSLHDLVVGVACGLALLALAALA